MVPTSEQIQLPDDWNEIVKAYSNKVQEVLDENGQKAVCWTYVNAPVGSDWKLIKARYNVCWQNTRDRSKFIPAFTDGGVLRNGMREMPVLRPVSLLLDKDEEGFVRLKIKRSGV